MVIVVNYDSISEYLLRKKGVLDLVVVFLVRPLGKGADATRRYL